MKKTYFVLGGLSAIAILLAGLGAASAFDGGERGDRAMGPRGGDADHRAEMQDLMETADYDTWRAVVEEHASEMGREELPPVLETITADNFDQFKQIHELREAGDHEGAKALAEELGLERQGHKKGMMKHRGEMRDTNGDGVCNKDDVSQPEQA